MNTLSFNAFLRLRKCRDCGHSREDHNVECVCTPDTKSAGRKYEPGCYHGMDNRFTNGFTLCACLKFKPAEAAA